MAETTSLSAAVSAAERLNVSLSELYRRAAQPLVIEVRTLGLDQALETTRNFVQELLKATATYGQLQKFSASAPLSTEVNGNIASAQTEGKIYQDTLNRYSIKRDSPISQQPNDKATEFLSDKIKNITEERDRALKTGKAEASERERLYKEVAEAARQNGVVIDEARKKAIEAEIDGYLDIKDQRDRYIEVHKTLDGVAENTAEGLLAAAQNGIRTGDLRGQLTGALRQVGENALGELAKLAIANPLRNLFGFGGNGATIDDLYDVIQPSRVLKEEEKQKSGTAGGVLSAATGLVAPRGAAESPGLLGGFLRFFGLGSGGPGGVGLGGFSFLPGFGFAGGGVMTAAGPLPLKRYAQGGIARSPQLALFGEGAGAEAYVPLPDGRAIPVAMTLKEGRGRGDKAKVAPVINQNLTFNMNGGGEGLADPQVMEDVQRELQNRTVELIENTLIRHLRLGGILNPY